MEKQITRSLYSLKPGQSAQIVDLLVDQKMADRLSGMGIIKHKLITRKGGSSPVLVCVSGTEVAIGKETAKKIIVSSKKNTFLLAGNPNVGKSLLFSRLTGVGIMSANFPGTTVGLHYGAATFGGESYNIIDIPGLYRLEERWNMEGKQRDLFKELEYDFVVCVADASHLERSLYFVLEVLALGKPVILLLNKSDEAARKGIHIDVRGLSKILGIPVIPVVATTGEGLKRLEATISRLNCDCEKREPVSALEPTEECAACGSEAASKRQIHSNYFGLKREKLIIPETSDGKWHLIGHIIHKVQKISHKHVSIVEKLQEWATVPATGLPIALGVLMVSFFLVIFLGEHLIGLLEPLYDHYWEPWMQALFGRWSDSLPGLLLLGNGGEQYFGVLTDGIKIALIDVMSYVLVFYALFGFLSELGYLPRLAVLMDRILHRFGLHGYGAIPIMLGFGCKVPAVMGVRVLESRRERVIALALILVMVPCISQTAMIISILSPYGLKYLLIVFFALLVNGIVIGSILNKIMKGDSPELFMEIPSWQWPRLNRLGRTLWLRMKEYLLDALPLILIGVLFVNLMQYTGLTELLVKLLRYPVEKILALPGEVTPLLLLGFLRKDVSIALLEPFHLAPQALVVACVFMTMYLPCIATFFVMLREVGVKDGFKVVGLTLLFAFISASVLRLLLY